MDSHRHLDSQTQNGIEDKITDFKEKLTATEKEIKPIRKDDKVTQSAKPSCRHRK